MIVYYLLSLTLAVSYAQPGRMQTGTYFAHVVSEHRDRNAEKAKQACLNEIKRFKVEPGVVGALDTRIWVCRRVNQ